MSEPRFTFEVEDTKEGFQVTRRNKNGQGWVMITYEDRFKADVLVATLNVLEQEGPNG